MNRRGFLSSLAAFVAVPFVPKPKPKPVGLMFHPDAFALTMKPLEMNFLQMRIGETITVRLPQRFKASDSLQPHLHDAFEEFERVALTRKA